MFSHCYPIIWMMKSKQQKSLNFPSFLFNTEVKPQSVTHQQLLKKKKKNLTYIARTENMSSETLKVMRHSIQK